MASCGLFTFREPRSPSNELKEIGAILQEFSQGKKKPLLTDARLLKNINREARVYWESQEITQTIAATATLSSPIVRVLGSLYTSLNKPPFEIRYFSSQSDALAWLKGFLKEMIRRALRSSKSKSQGSALIMKARRSSLVRINQMATNKIVETETDQQWLGEDGILYLTAFPNAEVTLESVRKITATQSQLAGGKKRRNTD